MIFIITGTQAPFDRMIKVIDQWAGKNNIQNVFAQIANSKYKPENITWESFMTPEEFDKKFSEADLIIAHAGMGTIISALQNDKPIVVMPRLAKYLEHRNDHQVGTANSFLKMGKIHVAFDEFELKEKLEASHNLKSLAKISSDASPQLIETIETYINS